MLHLPLSGVSGMRDFLINASSSFPDVRTNRLDADVEQLELILRMQETRIFK